jgi:hypothetical protein
MVKEKLVASRKEPTDLETKAEAVRDEAVENHLQAAMTAASKELDEAQTKQPLQAANDMSVSLENALATAKGNIDALNAQMQVQASAYRGYFDEANKAMAQQKRIVRMCEAALVADQMS